ncbi:hypothetical protein BDZ45DRAFT_752924 [Acephala macrosclerotiorum]|nr:hypothetical protein BDZ45DRAFT_752924 [Acephala macrosclerotiorum]
MFTIWLGLLLFHFCLVCSQSVPPDQTFDCTNPNCQVIYAACTAKDYSKCCALGTDCCAGGCCDLISSYVGQGTSQEQCCDVSDPTLCGTGPAARTLTCLVHIMLISRDIQLPLQSVLCSGASGLNNYYCPHGSTCNMHDDSYPVFFCSPEDDYIHARRCKLYRNSALDGGRDCGNLKQCTYLREDYKHNYLDKRRLRVSAHRVSDSDSSEIRVECGF